MAPSQKCVFLMSIVFHDLVKVIFRIQNQCLFCGPIKEGILKQPEVHCTNVVAAASSSNNESRKKGLLSIDQWSSLPTGFKCPSHAELNQYFSAVSC